MKSKLIKAGLIAGILLPMMVFAQTTGPGGIELISPVAGRQVDVAAIIKTIINWATGLLILLAVLFIIWAAFLYLTGAGDEEKAKKAKGILIFAAVAIAVALLAQGIVFIVTKLVAPSVDPGQVR